MSLSEQACSLLSRAQELLSGRGAWIRGDFKVQKNEDEDNPVYGYCLLGAVCEAAGVDAENDDAWNYPGPVRDAATSLVKQIDPDLDNEGAWFSPEAAIFRFNDKPSRRKGEVLSLIQKTREAEGCV